MLEYIHGGEDRAIFGAWDLIVAHALNETMDKLIASYKRGKYLQGVFGKAIKDFHNSEEALKQAVTIKYQNYQNYLSRCKFKLVCRTQSSVYDAEQEVWLPRNLKCMDTNIALSKIVSDLKCYCNENLVLSFPVFLTLISHLDSKFLESVKFFTS